MQQGAVGRLTVDTMLCLYRTYRTHRTDQQGVGKMLDGGASVWQDGTEGYQERLSGPFEHLVSFEAMMLLD